ncbi:MAG: RDD family protein [Acidimicrobiia bacterium]|nr:RDD family protein [Acidimicrobiia bacterium]
MQPSEQTDPMGVPRRVPTAKDFPKTGPFSLAAPGPRFGARALDLSVVALPVLVVVAITAKSSNGQLEFDVPSWLLPAALAFAIVYEFLFVLAVQRTPGKLLFGLRVVRYVDGSRPTATQCGLRALLPWSVLALPLGPFAVGAVVLVYGTGIGGELHRGWPDRVGGTLVISTR